MCSLSGGSEKEMCRKCGGFLPAGMRRGEIGGWFCDDCFERACYELARRIDRAAEVGIGAASVEYFRGMQELNALDIALEDIATSDLSDM